MQVKQVDKYLRHRIYCIGRRREDDTGFGMHSTFTFSPFSLRCVRLYVAWHSSGVGRSFFFQTQKSWILCFRSVRQSFAGNHANTGFVRHIPNKRVQMFIRAAWRAWTYRSFATRVSQLKIWHFWVTGVERNVCRCTFNRCSVITQFAKLAAGKQLRRRRSHWKW